MFFAEPDRTSSDSPVWGGYDGPLVTGVTVRPGRLLDQGSTASDVPADLLEYIEQVLQTQDYALYVLDGQRADLDPDDQDDWHDAVAIVEINRGLRMVKFTRAPDGAMNHYDPTERRSL